MQENYHSRQFMGPLGGAMILLTTPEEIPSAFFGIFGIYGIYGPFSPSWVQHQFQPKEQPMDLPKGLDQYPPWLSTPATKKKCQSLCPV
jgi:hypothetical protein